MSIIGSSRFSLAADASEPGSSPAASSESPDVDCCCRRDGLRLSLVLGIMGRTAGALGVVGDSGWDVMPVVSEGSVEGSRSTSRTGRSPGRSASMGGTVAAIDCMVAWRL